MRKVVPLVVFFLAAQASASIALFTDGRSMKISGYKLVDENAIQLTFKNGGVGIGKISPKVPKSFIAKMKTLKAQIIAGKIKPPSKL